MSKVPFYADADAIIKTDSGKREFAIFMAYLGLIFVNTAVLTVADNFDNVLLKTAAAFWLIGLPVFIFYRVLRAVNGHADELLKSVYNETLAQNGIGFVVITIIWFLSERWLSPDSSISNMIVTAAPYLATWSTYDRVRRKMITLSGDGA